MSRGEPRASRGPLTERKTNGLLTRSDAPTGRSGPRAAGKRATARSDPEPMDGGGAARAQPRMGRTQSAAAGTGERPTGGVPGVPDRVAKRSREGTGGKTQPEHRRAAWTPTEEHRTATRCASKTESHSASQNAPPITSVAFVPVVRGTDSSFWLSSRSSETSTSLFELAASQPGWLRSYLASVEPPFRVLRHPQPKRLRVGLSEPPRGNLEFGGDLPLGGVG